LRGGTTGDSSRGEMTGDDQKMRAGTTGESSREEMTGDDQQLGEVQLAIVQDGR